MSKQRNIRKRRALDELEELEDDQGGEPGGLSAEDIKLLQKERQRKTGVDATTIAVQTNPEKKIKEIVPAEQVEDGLQAAFNKERQELMAEDDPHMNKYIEQQLAHRLGKSQPGDSDSTYVKKPKTINEAALEAVALKGRTIDTDAAATWIEGVAEVPLDMKHRLKNIEATEAAKAALLSKGAASGGGGGGGQVRYHTLDEDALGSGSQSLRRHQFPVGFGQRPKNEEQRVQSAVAKKARMKAYQQEKKRKKEEEFAGW